LKQSWGNVQAKVFIDFSVAIAITSQFNRSHLHPIQPRKHDRSPKPNRCDRLSNKPKVIAYSDTSRYDRFHRNEPQGDLFHRLLPCRFSTDTLNPSEKAIAFSIRSREMNVCERVSSAIAFLTLAPLMRSVLQQKTRSPS
jgi:hypothetical protein